MTQIDFYILDSAETSAQLAFICRLTEKIYHQNHPLYIHLADQSSTTELDDWLWRFKSESFLPHDTNGSSQNTPIALGWHEIENCKQEIAINLTAQLPNWFSQCLRFIEIIPQQNDILALKREHWRFLKSRGYLLKTHLIKTQSFNRTKTFA